MATTSSAAVKETKPKTDNKPKADDKPKSAEKKGLLPPDEQFWQRYSSHHEFPLSTVASILLHGLVAAVLFLGIGLLAGFFRVSPEVDALQIEDSGGGGSKYGAEGAKTGIGKDEAVTQDPGTSKEAPPDAKTPKEELKKVDPSLAPIVDSQNARLIEHDVSMGVEQDEKSQSLRAMIEKLKLGNALKGKGGPGDGGGLGDGHGTGVGSGTGSGNSSKRAQRQLRWKMSFDPRDGEDHLRLLNGLGAIVAIPVGDDGTEYKVYENLTRRPLVPGSRKVSELNRMYWFDEDADSVARLSKTMGLEKYPTHIIFFFPIELEGRMLEKELAYRHVDEKKIKKTNFRIRRVGETYEPYVIDQFLE